MSGAGAACGRITLSQNATSPHRGKKDPVNNNNIEKMSMAMGSQVAKSTFIFPNQIEVAQLGAVLPNYRLLRGHNTDISDRIENVDDYRVPSRHSANAFTAPL